MTSFEDYKERAIKMMATLPDVLDEKTLLIVKNTAAVVEANIETITEKFYPYMFQTYPAVKNYFNLAHHIKQSADGTKTTQPFALAHAILRYVQHLTEPVALKNSLELAAQKHCALAVRAEHYPIVYECLMHAVKVVLGDLVTDEILDAWGNTILYIARAFIDREVEIYEEKQATEFGWFGWREFTVTEKKQETELITTYVLSPVDKGGIPTFEPGQYISLKFKNLIGAHAETTLRQYSISSAPGQSSFAIGVRLEQGDGPDTCGLVSNYLRNSVSVGDVLTISMPFGTLKLPPSGGKSVVLLAGGIGCTVTMSMLAQILKDKKFKKLYYVHAVRDGANHAYQQKVLEFQRDHIENFEYLRVYSQPRSTDALGVNYDIKGRPNTNTIKELVKEDLTTSNYVLCGPESLVSSLIAGLIEEGVPRENIQFECFGPLAKSLNNFA